MGKVTRMAFHSSPWPLGSHDAYVLGKKHLHVRSRLSVTLIIFTHCILFSWIFVTRYVRQVMSHILTADMYYDSLATYLTHPFRIHDNGDIPIVNLWMRKALPIRDTLKHVMVSKLHMNANTVHEGVLLRC
ncbi:hypothetical protein BU24DRAFT_133590 [Aaosphaeria arxii CBS 175.79]|uniref:Uncharacterized protein n=1 Tax=Aaosphaeria arxii CBS 175.79 TaxID=1450172 RepID=A0A6A5Y3J7_9PLEO|nr:uncharacterized protein BU24DRAFT_133590 [Aaosphaeria arxii CBS 175.79]KAF2020112.1 hypothetical protein BU24DRAFT_133590 [Aaosphaeria arxii CBS 175.79]